MKNEMWWDVSWNPITGCSPISEGCRSCYARRMANRLRGRFGYPKDDPFKVTFHPDRLDQPMKWKKPRRIFVCSMGDLFHDDVPFPTIRRIFFSIYRAKQHKFLILTKRPWNMLLAFECLKQFYKPHDFEHVWPGVSVENQQTADERIPILLQIPAAVRFVSVEPMLEGVDLFQSKAIVGGPCGGGGESGPVEYDIVANIDWVIAGPETGPGARECKPEWIADLYEQCKAAGVPFFHKAKNYLAREFPGGA